MWSFLSSVLDYFFLFLKQNFFWPTFPSLLGSAFWAGWRSGCPFVELMLFPCHGELTVGALVVGIKAGITSSQFCCGNITRTGTRHGRKKKYNHFFHKCSGIKLTIPQNIDEAATRRALQFPLTGEPRATSAGSPDLPVTLVRLRSYTARRPQKFSCLRRREKIY